MNNQQPIDNLYIVIKEIDSNHRFDNAVLSLISSVWNIYQEPSTGEDPRYSNLGDEIEKHYFMNDDWNQDKLYVGVLHIKDDINKILLYLDGLLKFVNIAEYEAVAHRLTEALSAMNKEVVNIGNSYTIVDARSKSPVINSDGIPFIRCESHIVDYSTFTENDIKWADEVEYFALTFNYKWNDFGYKTWYNLYYVNNGAAKHIGKLKILCKKGPETEEFLPKRFYNLDPDFCSLGYHFSYYAQMREVIGVKALSTLLSLRDIALYTSVNEEFKQAPGYTQSLLRVTSSGQALREGRYRVNGRDMADAYSFTFHYEPAFDTEKVSPQDITFTFTAKCYPFQRVYGLIGENGSGKTTLLYQIAKELVSKDRKNFIGSNPIYGSVMMMSYSAFDHEMVQPTDNTIKYIYSGLLKDNSAISSKDELQERFISNLEAIAKQEHSDDHLWSVWEHIMSYVIDADIISSFLISPEKINQEKIKEYCNKISSGELVYIFTLTDFIAHIRKDTLFLFDEPEQHLHPHAITMLMKGIFELLNYFESYAIIATHSPLIIRELLSSNVYTFNRNQDLLDVSKIGIESFGEDVTTLSNIIFKNLLDEKRFEKHLEEIARDNNFDFNRIVNALQTGGNVLSLSARLMIRSIIDRNKE